MARQLCLSSDMQLDTWVFLGVVGGGNGNGGGSGDGERWCWRVVAKLWLPPVPHMFRIIDKRLITPVVGWGIIRCVNVSGRRDANHDQVKRADGRTLEVQDKLIKCQRKLSEGVMSCKSLHSLTRLPSDIFGPMATGPGKGGFQ